MWTLFTRQNEINGAIGGNLLAARHRPDICSDWWFRTDWKWIFQVESFNSDSTWYRELYSGLYDTESLSYRLYHILTILETFLSLFYQKLLNFQMLLCRYHSQWLTNRKRWKFQLESARLVRPINSRDSGSFKSISFNTQKVWYENSPKTYVVWRQMYMVIDHHWSTIVDDRVFTWRTFKWRNIS